MEDSLLGPRCDLVSRPSLAVFQADNEPPYALLVEDQKEILEHFRAMLLAESCQVLAFGSAADAARQMQNGLRPDLALIDTRMRAADGVSALAWLYKTTPAVPIIGLSCSDDPRSIVEAMKMGASDVLVQPFDRLELRRSLKSCMEASLARIPKQVREIPLTPNTSFVFCCERTRAIALQCELIAPTDVPVLILGESGTGKEILAQYIHKIS